MFRFRSDADSPQIYSCRWCRNLELKHQIRVHPNLVLKVHRLYRLCTFSHFFGVRYLTVFLRFLMVPYGFLRFLTFSYGFSRFSNGFLRFLTVLHFGVIWDIFLVCWRVLDVLVGFCAFWDRFHQFCWYVWFTLVECSAFLVICFGFSIFLVKFR